MSHISLLLTQYKHLPSVNQLPRKLLMKTLESLKIHVSIFKMCLHVKYVHTVWVTFEARCPKTYQRCLPSLFLFFIFCFWREGFCFFGCPELIL